MFLVNDEHGERADDVEARYEEDESEEDVRDELLNLHNLEGVFLLLIAVKHLIAVTQLVLDARLDTFHVCIGLEAHFNGGYLVGALEESASKGEIGDNVL